MKNQIYIFLVIISSLFGCKTDSPNVEPDNIFYWKADVPKSFVRNYDTIDYHSDVLSPIEINFESEKLANNSYNTNLWLEGGDSLLFVSQDKCYSNLEFNQLISDSNTSFSNTISIDYITSGEIYCTPSDTFYIGFKRRAN